MSRTISSLTLAAIAGAAVSIAAQTPPPSPSQEAPPAAVITIVGCVEPADQSATGQPSTGQPSTGQSTSASTKGDTKYHLTHAKAGKKSESSTSSPGASSQPTASTYRLDAKDSALSPHVGHMVEIVAIVPEPDTSAATGTTAAAGMPPKVKVQTVKMIAAECEP